MLKLLPVQIEQLIIDYKRGLSQRECAKLFNVSVGTVSRMIRKYSKSRLKRHIFKEDFFEQINTPTKAYWFGFLAADGFAKKSGNGYRLKLTLKAADGGHIEKFKNALESDHTIKNGWFHNSLGSFEHATITISSKKMIEDLHNNGLYEFKDNCIIPKLLRNLQKHFWRGFFDGDGWVCFNRYGHNKKWPRSVVGFCGDKQTMEQLQQVLSLHCAANINKIYPNKSVFTIKYSGSSQALRILNWLYEDSEAATILDRKYIIYKQISEYKRAK